MPFVGLYVKAELENVAKIEFAETTDWTLDVQQSSSDEIRERITINGQEEFEVPNSKGTANFIVKFEGAKAFSTMNMVVAGRKELKDMKTLKGVTLGVYPESAEGKMSLVAIFDCRGAEPCKWYPVGPFTVTSKGGKVFQDVDLSDEDGWCEYDEGSEMSVMISGVGFEFKVVK
ncbi:unnamed protein product [Polarella glacialis]|uniref:Uncharacterized protein n=1 Tax=Polarella glacialis TaxID=89957 RepID=A0A813KHJ1_POLGL|nr:unnamed protein product [Polarella glacialis]CAE8704992.1 unnamed protein product [Polarella glacialis]|mmetsp:Transcript_43730/g.70885  ORF Transcript_43730/g.70885 Transcript_43730/m.70885 type:complete len:174 (-) Transcript_43730:80-601(-)